MQPGMAYSVAYKGTTLKAGGIGVKVKGSNDVPDSTTIFRIGSVSKVFAVSLKSKLDQAILRLCTTGVKYCRGITFCRF